MMIGVIGYQASNARASIGVNCGEITGIASGRVTRVYNRLEITGLFQFQDHRH
jgi:hypothetical protein